MSDILFAVPCRCGGCAIVHQDTRALGLERGGWAVDCERGIECPHRPSAWWKVSREAAVREWNEMQQEPIPAAPPALQCRRLCGPVIPDTTCGGYWVLECNCGTVASKRSADHARQMYIDALGIRQRDGEDSGGSEV